MDAHVVSHKPLAAGHFLELDLIDYQAADGKLHNWEAVQRKNTNSAAVIIATLRPSGRILLIRQFRPPVGKYVIEVPAGLIDPGEDALTTARRELQEETGYTGIPLWHSGPTASSAGLTGEALDIVSVDIDETLPENQNPPQNLQDAEAIEVFPVAIPEIGAFLHQAILNGDAIDSRLAAWAIGRNIRW